VSAGNVNSYWTQLAQPIEGVGNGGASGNAPDHFGCSISMSYDGSVVAVGAYQGDVSSTEDTGIVKVLKYSSSSWTQKGSTLEGAADTNFGNSVSLSYDGQVLAVGAIDKAVVYVYDTNSNDWQLPGIELSEPDSNCVVSLSGDGTTLAIGANNNGDNGIASGRVRVFRYSASAWNLIGTINGENAGDNSGVSVSLSADGNTVAIGATGYSIPSQNVGQVRVFSYSSGTTWTLVDAAIVGENIYDNAGKSVSLSADGQTLAVGEYGFTTYGTFTYSGRARVFELSSGTWAMVAELYGSPAAHSYFGDSLSLSADGTRLAVSFLGFTQKTGAVRLYRNNAGTWEQDENDLIGESAGDRFGSSVSMAGYGGALAVGADGRNTDNGDDFYYGSTATGGTGAAYFYGQVQTATTTEQPTNAPTPYVPPTSAPTAYVPPTSAPTPYVPTTSAPTPYVPPTSAPTLTTTNVPPTQTTTNAPTQKDSKEKKRNRHHRRKHRKGKKRLRGG
jgi:hypothetical protein